MLIDASHFRQTLGVLGAVRFEALLFGVSSPTFWAVAHGAVLLGAAQGVLATRVLHDAGVGANGIDTSPVCRAV